MPISKWGNMSEVFKIFQDRGFIEQTTHDKELFEYLNKEDVSCYIGFDPTAPTLHVGSLVPIMALAHFQRSGHRPVALVGGGTGLVGDPSGKTETRNLLTPEKVDANALSIKKQLSSFVDFDNGRGLLLNNATWLRNLDYISFLRDIGKHFSVNRMIKAESYKMRLASEEGLNFIEFNYMLLQAYDFLKLSDKYGCMLQMGGSDQWGNIVAGIELIRRVNGKTAFGITFPLITTSNGEKMGKTVKGAVWLDSEKTTPYEYYQYWINTDDRDVVRFLSLFSFLPMDEIRMVGKLTGADLNNAKSILAFETTALLHGKKEALKAFDAAAIMFGARAIPKGLLASSEIPREIVLVGDDSVPCSAFNFAEFEKGVPAFKIFHLTGLAKTGGASRRLIQQGGAYVNGVRVGAIDYLISVCDIKNMEIMLRAGKKKYHKIKIIK